MKADEDAELQRKITKIGGKKIRIPEDLPSPSYLASVDEANDERLPEGPPGGQTEGD